MLVQYSLKSFPSGQLIQGEFYLVIEIYIDFEREKTSYRIVSNTGCPAIYEADGFEIVSGNLDGYYWVQDKDDYIIITQLSHQRRAVKKELASCKQDNEPETRSGMEAFRVKLYCPKTQSPGGPCHAQHNTNYRR